MRRMSPMHGIVPAAFLLLLLVAPAAPDARPDGAFPRGRVVIETADGRRIPIRVEIARTPDQRSRGLMGRRSLARDAGMLFVFGGDVRGGFWMKNTRIPLAIAFHGRRGRILRIMVMTPCRADPCPTYDPGLRYRGALEVNRGSFTRWRVRRGDTIRLVRG